MYTHSVCVLAPPISDGLLRHGRSSRLSPSMIMPPPSTSSECSMRPPSPSTLRWTSKPNALHNQSMCLAALRTVRLDEIRGQFLGGGLLAMLIRQLLTRTLVNRKVNRFSTALAQRSIL